jgi:mRNA interferase RelE/StbE
MDVLEPFLFRRIDAKILALRNNPRSSGYVKLRGFKDHCRIRIGQYRVIYIIDDNRKDVIITRVAHRSEVYEP